MHPYASHPAHADVDRRMDDAMADSRIGLGVAARGGADRVARLALLDALDGRLETMSDLLRSQGLAALWHYALAPFERQDERAARACALLQPYRFANAAFYAAQAATLAEVGRVFEQHGIAYAAFKGAHIREIAYADPALRVASDIDILISPDDRLRAAQLLTGLGLISHAAAENISHEATFSRDGVDIDLHWDLLRPGRLRGAVARQVLARRVRVKDLFGLAVEDAAFVLLVHPAFAKYVNSPHASLATIADFCLLAQSHVIDWAIVGERLAAAGVTTSAWAMLQWWSRLLGPDMPRLPATFLQLLEPGPLRARYLRHWIDHRLVVRWIDKSLLIQAGFTLFLHDLPSDALRAIAGLARARRLQSDPLLQSTG